MDILKAQKKDLKYCAKIFQENISQNPFNYNIDGKESLTIINEYFNNQIIFISKEKESITGFIIGDKYLRVGGWRLRISELFVDLNNQGKGIGKKLLETIENHFKKENIKIIELITHKDAKAIKFYEKSKYKTSNYIKLEKNI